MRHFQHDSHRYQRRSYSVYNNPPGSSSKESHTLSPINHFQRELVRVAEIIVSESASLMDDSNVPCWGGNIEERRGWPNLTEVQFCHKLLLKIMTVPSSSSSREHCFFPRLFMLFGYVLPLENQDSGAWDVLFLAAESVSPALVLHLRGKRTWLLWMCMLGLCLKSAPRY